MNVLREIAEWLMSWGADRWLHFLVGLFAGFVSAGFVEAPLWLAAQVGVVVATVGGLAKECVDAYVSDSGDYVDWLFTIAGGVTGVLLYVSARLAL